MATIEEVYANLPKELKHRVKYAMEISPEKLQTPSMGINIALKGGLGFGRITTIWGTKSAGKTAFCLQLIAQAQAVGKTGAFVDVEGTFESNWAESLGVKNTELLHTYAKSVERVTDTTVGLINAGVDIIVIDSTSAMAPGSYLEGEEFKGFKYTGKIGADSQDLGKMLRSINMVNENKGTLIILIAQGRMAQVSSVHWGLKATGGKAIEYYSTSVIKLQSGAGANNFIDSEIVKGDVILNEIVGRNVNWTVEFNKLGPQGGTGSYDFYFQGDYLGVDRVGEVADLAVKYQVIQKSGAWLKYNEEQFHGRDKFAEKLRYDEAFMSEIEGKLIERI